MTPSTINFPIINTKVTPHLVEYRNRLPSIFIHNSPYARAFGIKISKEGRIRFELNFWSYTISIYRVGYLHMAPPVGPKAKDFEISLENLGRKNKKALAFERKLNEELRQRNKELTDLLFEERAKSKETLKKE
jgi:hypothetical protein